MLWLTWALPAAFLTVAAVHAVGGRGGVAALYVALAVGTALHGLGVRQGVRPMQWFGAGVTSFALVVLLWVTFG